MPAPTSQLNETDSIKAASKLNQIYTNYFLGGDASEWEKEDKKEDIVAGNLLAVAIKETVAIHHLEELEALHKSFCETKRLMLIPHETQIAEITALGKQILESEVRHHARVKLVLTQIQKDKLIFAHTKYIDDMQALIRLAQEIKITSGVKQENLSKDYNALVTRMKQENQDKNEYVDLKKKYMKQMEVVLLEKTPPKKEKGNDTEEDHAANLDGFFLKCYIKNNNYKLSVITPNEFKNDLELKLLDDKISEAQQELDSKLKKSFKMPEIGAKNTAELEFQKFIAQVQDTANPVVEFIDDMSKTGSSLVRSIQGLFIKGSKNMEEKTPKSSSAVLENKDPSQNDSITITELESKIKKELLVAKRERIAVLVQAQKVLDAKISEYHALTRQIADLNDELDVPDVYKIAVVEKLKLAQSNVESLFKNIGNYLSGTPTNLSIEIQNNLVTFTSKVNNLTKIKTELESLKQLKTDLNQINVEQKQLIAHIESIKQDTDLARFVFIDSLKEEFLNVQKSIAELSEKFNTQDVSELVEKYQSQKAEQTTKLEELKAIEKQFIVYQNNKTQLKEKFLTKEQLDKRFEHIAEENRKYWGKLMHVEFAHEGAEVEAIVGDLEQFIASNDVTSKIKDALRSPSAISEFLKDGAVVLGGAALGAGLGLASSTLNSLVSLNPFSTGATGIAATGAGALFGGILAGVLFKEYKEFKGGGDEAQLLEQFRQEIGQLNLINLKEYQDLVSDIVVDMVTCESLLLGASSGVCPELRQQFITENNNKNNPEEINKAIQTLFLKNLQPRINDGFARIFNIHSQEVEKFEQKSDLEKTILKVLKGRKNYVKQYSVFTAKIQFTFLRAIEHMLDTAKNQTSIHSKRFVKLAKLAGFFTVCASVAGIILAFPPTAIALSAVAVTVLSIACWVCGTASVLSGIAALWNLAKGKYIRSESHREFLGDTAKQLREQRHNKEAAVEQTVDIGEKEFVALEKLEAKINASGMNNFVDKVISLWKEGTFEGKEIAAGGKDVWLRQYYSCYRDSALIRGDVQDLIKSIMIKAAEQTQRLQFELLGHMVLHDKDRKHPILDRYINDTLEFLLTNAAQKADPQNFYNMQQKIKEQVLEIVSAIPAAHGPLPKALTDFYINNLGGALCELERARVLNTVVDVQTKTNELELKLRMDRSEDTLLAGSKVYRRLIGRNWSSEEQGLVGVAVQQETVITPENIYVFLKNSLQFLTALDKGIDQRQMLVSDKFDHTVGYTLYRSLLLMQLAELTDPLNENYNEIIAEKINQFAIHELYITNPANVFRELRNQRNIIEQSAGASDPDKAPHNIVDAVRVCLAYDTQMTPKFLVDQIIYKNKLPKDLIFGYSDNIGDLGVRADNRYHLDIKKCIDRTESLLKQINNNPILKSYNADEVFLRAAVQDIDKVIQLINNDQLITRYTNEEKAILDGEIKTLTQYKNVLNQRVIILHLLDNRASVAVKSTPVEKKYAANEQAADVAQVFSSSSSSSSSSILPLNANEELMTENKGEKQLEAHLEHKDSAKLELEFTGQEPQKALQPLEKSSGSRFFPSKNKAKVIPVNVEPAKQISLEELWKKALENAYLESLESSKAPLVWFDLQLLNQTDESWKAAAMQKLMPYLSLENQGFLNLTPKTPTEESLLDDDHFAALSELGASPFK